MFKRSLLPLSGGLLTAALIAVIVIVLFKVHAVGLHNCLQIETVKAGIRTSILHSLAVLGRPRSPGYSYYLTHPAELQIAHHNLISQLHLFTPYICK